ncbi:MAG: hypothetical protein EOO15_04920 [Chitinophagaceae bacterium]|nr:MAG: hypothetical protein EOO15_04920 [Chitinophagaceae bacterium]
MKKEINAPSSKQFRLLFYTVQSLLLLTSINALAAGYSMIADPSGKGLGFPEGMLAQSPFGSYLLPGILLFVFVGALPLAVFVLLAFPRPGASPKLAWWGAFCFGAGLLVWIVTQVLLIGFVFFLQAVIGGVAIVAIAICLSPAFRKHYLGS